MNDDLPEIDPNEAEKRRQGDGRTVIIDVRSQVEYEFVGHPIGAVHIPWKEFPNWEENTDFCMAVDSALSRETSDDILSTPLLMLCRSGARSLAAGKKLAEYGYTDVTNIAEGFEGDKDKSNHRSNLNGWRYHGLPWEQS